MRLKSRTTALPWLTRAGDAGRQAAAAACLGILLALVAGLGAAEAASSPAGKEAPEEKSGPAPLSSPAPAPTPARDLVPTRDLQEIFDKVAEESRRAARAEETDEERQTRESLGNLPPALMHHGESLRSSNLQEHVHDGFVEAGRRGHQTQFDVAVKQRERKLYDLAINNFTGLLEAAETPPDMKKAALLELALIAEERDQFGRAIQVYAQYLKRFGKDPTIPEVYLRQGLLYRRLGAPNLALSKLYAVMTSALTLKSGSFDYYKGLVLQAQTEIADTYFMQGKLEAAADFFRRLLSQNSPGLNRAEIRYKLIRCYQGLGLPTETVAQARLFLEEHAGSEAEPEVRFLLAQSLKNLGQNSEALEQVLRILQTQQVTARSNPTNWLYWQQRTGNQIANQLYQEGDYISALSIYTTLAELNISPQWTLPALYQIGLVYEKLEQPQKAIEHYQRLLEKRDALATPPSPALKTLLEMAGWRSELLEWKIEIGKSGEIRNAPYGGNPTNNATAGSAPASSLPIDE